MCQEIKDRCRPCGRCNTMTLMTMESEIADPYGEACSEPGVPTTMTVATPMCESCQDLTVNGWSNRATWVLFTEISNYEPAYNACLYIVNNSKSVAEVAEKLTARYGLDPGVAQADQPNYTEIAEALVEATR